MKLSLWLKRNKLSQRALARRLNIHHQTIWRAIQGTPISRRLATMVSQETAGEVSVRSLVLPSKVAE